MITLFDSIDISQIPPNAEAVAGYVGGRWPTYPDLVKRFPHAHCLSIAVNATQHARCLDVEPGDASPDQCPGWFRTHADRNQGKPVLYSSASNVNAVRGAMTRAGIGRDQYYLWSAHYTFREHICSPETCGYPQTDMTQWTDKAMGRNLDQSCCQDYVFSGVPPRPAPGPKPKPTQSLVSVVNVDGRIETFEELADGSVAHRWQTAENNGWVESWQSLGRPG